MDKGKKIQICLPDGLDGLITEQAKKTGVSKSDAVLSRVLDAIENDNQMMLLQRFLCWIRTTQDRE